MSIRSKVRFVLSVAVFFMFGAYLARTGWSGLQAGKIIVHRKLSPDYVAYATGSTAGAFENEVWLRIGGGAFFIILSGACVLAMLFSSPRRRSAMIVAFDASIDRKRLVVPAWFAAFIITAFVGMLLWAAVRVS